MIDPTPGQARDALRRELLQPAYQERDVVRRGLAALGRLLDEGLAAAAGAGWLQVLAAMAALVVLVAVVGGLAARTRGAGRLRPAPSAILPPGGASADVLQARARAALTAGLLDQALLDGFRAWARRQVEVGRIADDPGATAVEVALAVAGSVVSGPASYPSSGWPGAAAAGSTGPAAHDVPGDLPRPGSASATDALVCARWFDAVAYGHRTASEEQVRAVLALDREPVGRR